MDHYCAGDFEILASKDPDELLSIAREELNPALLTYVAEALGYIEGKSEEVSEALLQLCNHPKGFVRQGALLGVSLLDDIPETIQSKLRELAAEDLNPSVRRLAGILRDTCKI